MTTWFGANFFLDIDNAEVRVHTSCSALAIKCKISSRLEETESATQPPPFMQRSRQPSWYLNQYFSKISFSVLKN